MKDGGRIVNISSGLARFSIPGTSAYGAAKGAIEVLTRYLAKELGARGITANVVAPGAIETDFSGGIVRDNPEINKQPGRIRTCGLLVRSQSDSRKALIIEQIFTPIFLQRNSI